MNMFEAVRMNVTARVVAEHYGLKVNHIPADTAIHFIRIKPQA